MSKYKNLTIIEHPRKVYEAQHKNGTSISFTADKLTNPWLVRRLRYFNDTGTEGSY